MVVFPNCKINLGLRVLDKRADGYHDLDTVFVPVPLRDAAEIIPCHLPPNAQHQPFELQVTGLAINGTSEQNLCYKAWELISRDFTRLPPVKMYLHKAIPSGAGLGGGSADGAFTLRLLNDMFRLNLSDEQLITYALQLGSDCPFFIINRPCHASGRGEILREISLRLDDYSIAIVDPGIHVNTGQAFADLATSRVQHSRRPQTSPVMDVVSNPVDTWKEELVNDFEEPVFRIHPRLHEIKMQLYKAGAVYASMSGSGSSIFGLFRKSDQWSFPTDASYNVYRLNSSL